MHPGGSDGGGLSSQCSPSHEREAEGSQVGRTREEVVSAQAPLSVQEEPGGFSCPGQSSEAMPAWEAQWGLPQLAGAATLGWEGWDQPR